MVEATAVVIAAWWKRTGGASRCGYRPHLRHRDVAWRPLRYQSTAGLCTPRKRACSSLTPLRAGADVHED
ncbi:hypothetical protein CHLRE_12g540351v5 [Chlamydomonas reinhardtii]|uniref:Uncharacterized protein n=1 Tax=Chlamydomonas reinhardtii TaxID=3055 RepID=A0A2K3D6Y7_CHLRE|nr:uncharacterized protein CHLRE_12g540351v5 [Chlamydomonas reinhardtii]PNW76294.1 hypothetical protein CHLRE_12g540351v5 [Chlamydomonas reinhardtii]